MVEKENDIEIVDDDKSEIEIISDDGTAEAAPGKVTEDGGADDDIETYKKKLKEAEERAARAEKERDERKQGEEKAKSDTQKAYTQAIQRHEEAVANAISAAESEFERAQAAWDDAFDAGDKTALREATLKLNDAQMKKRGAEYQKAQFEAWKEQQKNAPKIATETVASSRYSKSEQEWIDRHPRFNTDRKYRAAVYAADEEAREKGISPDTPAYYEYVEKALRDEGLEGDDEEAAPVAKPKKMAKTSTAAPASSSSAPSSTSTGGKRTFRMTAQHREAAAVCFPELYRTNPKAAEEKYAKKQLEIQEKKSRGEI